MNKPTLVFALMIVTSAAHADDAAAKLTPETLSPHDYILSLHASHSGPGILVCEPVPSTKTDPALVDFAGSESE